jgi:integrating conjugative element protein (TIGR03746 family)
MAYLDALAAQKATNKVLMWMCAGFFGLALVGMWGWKSSTKDITVHLPPDLRSGARVKSDEVHPANVYTFAFYIWQQVNRWPLDGDKDYGQAIFKLAPYLTPSCRQKLESDMNRKASAGELTSRVRALQEIAGHGYEEARVMPQGNGLWKVSLDAEIIETVRGVAVKTAYVRYPLRVVQFEGDRDANPFMLALDCWADQELPTRLDLKAELQAAADAQRPRSAAGGAAGTMQNALTR